MNIQHVFIRKACRVEKAYCFKIPRSRNSIETQLKRSVYVASSESTSIFKTRIVVFFIKFICFPSSLMFEFAANSTNHYIH